MPNRAEPRRHKLPWRRVSALRVRIPHASWLLAALALAACHTDDRGPARPAAPAPPPAATAGSANGWRTNPAAGVQLAAGGDSLAVETGPHTILWQAPAAELVPPYTVRATFEKQQGRLHEGYGLLFGGTGLDGPEAQQSYGYFLVRGDGTFLVKRRQGAATPVVIDWTEQPVIRRDREEVGQPNQLEVRVGQADVAFLVNGMEVARVPAADLPVRGVAGVRTAHEVSLVVRGFRAEAGR